jgi:hypothetical protein
MSQKTKALGLDDLDLDKVRLNIIKSMFKDFPELKNQIIKTMLHKPANKAQERKKKSLSKFMSDPTKETMPDWIKLALATQNKGKKDRYYYFK